MSARSPLAPPPTGSREIPGWLQAVLLVLTAFVIAAFAPGAHAASGGSTSATASFLEAVTAAAPINCQGDVDYAATIPLNDFWTVCGYRYDWPAAPVLPLPPVIDPHTPPTTPVPEPASWMLMLAGLGVLLLVLLARALRSAIALADHTEGPQP